MNESQVFTNALKFANSAERAAYLDQACGENAQLRAEVEALLAAHDTNPDFLEQTAGSFAGAIDALSASAAKTSKTDGVEQPGQMLAGRFKLLEAIGEGGMGTVWMARQTDPIKRYVAVKLLKAGMDSRAVLARFEAERQALALMDHPNIARVFDAGTTESGHPFFVMELVKGVPITCYCDEHRLTPRQRLELFVQVCRAVQHAHQKGVIHRDLKPSNVLVAEYDGVPVPKVIDFGVAKATGQQLTEQTLHTGFGAVVGTPEYMSPEQATFNQLDVDTRSDVYSLGVLLYELLTGSPPFTKKDLGAAGVLEMLRVIREQEPSRPSAKLSTAEGLPTLAANRGTEPARLTRLVRGELDWVVMKALEKDRNRRYETANGLAMDVQRYLADEVVAARPPSARYRLRKFVRRNRGAVGAALALALALLIGGAAVLTVKAQADRDRAAAETDRAARDARADASVAAAVREARERAVEAWAVTDFPDRMQQAADAAVAAVCRAEEFAAGGTLTDVTRDDLESTRRIVDDLRRHVRLITADSDNRQQFADSLTGSNVMQAVAGLRRRATEALRQYGVDPIDGPADAAARAIAASRVRDTILGMLSWWDKYVEELHRGHRLEGFDDEAEEARVLGALEAEMARLREVLGTARRLCGGPYARWQDLLDRNDVPDLAAFAASPDSLGFKSTLIAALARDLGNANQHEAHRAYLRAAVDRYPHDAWLHWDLSTACMAVQPPDRHEALRHASAASALRPGGARFHVWVGQVCVSLEAEDAAIVAFRKAIALAPKSFYSYQQLGDLLRKKKDWRGALKVYREYVGHNPDNAPMRVRLGGALMATGLHAEGLQEILTGLRMYPPQTNDPRSGLRFEAARHVMNVAEGKGMKVSSPAEQEAYRRQALEWLTADVEAIRKRAAADRAFGYRTLARWLRDEDLASVRDPTTLVGLLPDEREAWARLWAEVRDLRDAGEIPALQESIRRNSAQFSVHCQLGTALEKTGDAAGAVASYREALRINKDHGLSHNGLAWLLATGPDDVREGRRAVEHAARACELTDWNKPNYIDTLAAAHAEAGDFGKAVEYQTKALSSLAFPKEEEAAARQRLALYFQKMPYRAPFRSRPELAPPPRVVNR